MAGVTSISPALFMPVAHRFQTSRGEKHCLLQLKLNEDVQWLTNNKQKLLKDRKKSWLQPERTE